MFTRPWWVLSVLVFGCTSHDVNDEQARARPEPPDPVEAPAPEQLEREPAPWTPGPRTPLRHKPLTGAIGDVTGDGQPDVVAIAYIDGPETGIMLLAGAPDGLFDEAEPIPVHATGVELGDFDRDGDLDALLLDARSRPAYQVAINDGAGNFELGSSHRIPGSFGGELRHAALADLDADGDLDAIVPLWDSLRILHGDGRGGFEPGQRLGSGRDPFSCAIADLDGDGHLDVVATSGAAIATDKDSYHSSGAALWFYRGTARGFSEADSIELAGADELAVADLDGDGQLELVATGSAGITVVRDPLGARGLQLIPVATDGGILITEFALPIGPDLLTSSYMQSRVHVLSLNGYPAPSKVSLEVGNFVVGLFAADVAKDGTLEDLVLLNAGPPGGSYGEPEPSIEVVFVGGQSGARLRP